MSQPKRALARGTEKEPPRNRETRTQRGRECVQDKEKKKDGCSDQEKGTERETKRREIRKSGKGGGDEKGMPEKEN